MRRMDAKMLSEFFFPLRGRFMRQKIMRIFRARINVNVNFKRVCVHGSGCKLKLRNAGIWFGKYFRIWENARKH